MTPSFIQNAKCTSFTSIVTPDSIILSLKKSDQDSSINSTLYSTQNRSFCPVMLSKRFFSLAAGWNINSNDAKVLYLKQWLRRWGLLVLGQLGRIILTIMWQFKSFAKALQPVVYICESLHWGSNFCTSYREQIACVCLEANISPTGPHALTTYYTAAQIRG